MREPLVVAMSLLVVLACTPSYPPCYRGEYRGCTCASGATGYAACNADEDGFDGCVCDGKTPGIDAGRDASSSEGGEAGDAGDAGDATPEGGAAGAYMTPCGPNDACLEADAVCFAFGTKGKVCTKRCALAAECPPPSPGCSVNQAVCRAP